MNDKILLVGGDDQSHWLVSEALRELGCRVTACAEDSARAADRALDAEPADLVVVNHPWPRDLSRDLIERWSRHYPVLVLCSEAAIEIALELMRWGATEFLVKPVEPRELAEAIRRIVDNAVLNRSDAFYDKLLQDRERTAGARLGDAAPGVTLEFDREPTLAEIERRYASLLLARHAGNRKTVADLLGIDESALERLVDDPGRGAG